MHALRNLISKNYDRNSVQRSSLQSWWPDWRHRPWSNWFKRLSAAREVSDTEEEKIADAIGRLAGLTNFPFIALELSQQCTEEQVADVFVRINSEGKKLNQSDFILTLMSVFWDDGRSELEAFCRAARQPAPAGQPSPFNQIFQPDPDHLLRVDVGVAFRRARLEHVYSLLRGKDLATGEVNPGQRDNQFSKLRHAQARVLDLTYWADFLNIVRAAGFRSAKTISSVNALVFAYQLYLLGRTEYDVDGFQLKNSIARWLFMSLLTGRFTSSPESRMEQDLAELRELKSADQFLNRLSGVEVAADRRLLDRDATDGFGYFGGAESRVVRLLCGANTAGCTRAVFQ